MIRGMKLAISDEHLSNNDSRVWRFVSLNSSSSTSETSTANGTSSLITVAYLLGDARARTPAQKMLFFNLRGSVVRNPGMTVFELRERNVSSLQQPASEPRAVTTLFETAVRGLVRLGKSALRA